MKIISTLAICGVGVLPLTLGCRAESLGVEPDGTSTPSFASRGNPAWPKPKPVEGINSPSTDQQPALSKDGLSLYFASNRSGGVGSFDLWVAQRECTDECPWSTPQLLPTVNSELPDISPTLSRDGHQLFFASQRSNGHCTVNPPTIPQCDRDLWVSYRENVHDDFGWQEPVNLGDGPSGINSAREELAPSYFENDDGGVPQLFFNDGVISGGALVGGDIYVSQMVNGTWGSPSPVVDINGPSSDQRPSISHDGLELYFWSARDGGVARLWVATRQSVSDAWSVPQERVQFPSSDGDQPTLMPFIHSHGRTETLLFVRGVPGIDSGRDIWMSERTRLSGGGRGQ